MTRANRSGVTRASFRGKPLSNGGEAGSRCGGTDFAQPMAGCFFGAELSFRRRSLEFVHDNHAMRAHAMCAHQYLRFKSHRQHLVGDFRRKSRRPRNWAQFNLAILPGYPQQTGPQFKFSPWTAPRTRGCCDQYRRFWTKLRRIRSQLDGSLRRCEESDRVSSLRSSPVGN